MKKIKYFTHPKESIFAGMQIREDTDEAFENAIKKGMKNPEDWMYMYSEDGKDYFKHCDTREYVAYQQFGIITFIKIKIREYIIERRKSKK